MILCLFQVLWVQTVTYPLVLLAIIQKILIFIASEVANNETESENSKIITEIDTKDTTITAINSEVTQHKEAALLQVTFINVKPPKKDEKAPY